MVDLQNVPLNMTADFVISKVVSRSRNGVIVEAAAQTDEEQLNYFNGFVDRFGPVEEILHANTNSSLARTGFSADFEKPPHADGNYIVAQLAVAPYMNAFAAKVNDWPDVFQEGMSVGKGQIYHLHEPVKILNLPIAPFAYLPEDQFSRDTMVGVLEKRIPWGELASRKKLISIQDSPELIENDTGIIMQVRDADFEGLDHAVLNPNHTNARVGIGSYNRQNGNDSDRPYWLEFRFPKRISVENGLPEIATVGLYKSSMRKMT